MAHTCHANNCTVKVPPKMFMCKTHWFMLPRLMRDQVWAVYVPGQEDRKDPSPEYLEIARQCITFIEYREAR